MHAHRFHSLITIFTLACFLLLAWSVPADAQKKTKAKVQQKEQTKDTPKDEQKDEQEEKEKTEEKSEEVTPAPAPTPASLPNKFIDVLKQHIGEKTNLGTLKKFYGDYVTFEDENSTIIVPLTSIQSAKLTKDEDSGKVTLELKLISKD